MTRKYSYILKDKKSEIKCNGFIVNISGTSLYELRIQNNECYRNVRCYRIIIEGGIKEWKSLCMWCEDIKLCGTEIFILRVCKILPELFQMNT